MYIFLIAYSVELMMNSGAEENTLQVVTETSNANATLNGTAPTLLLSAAARSIGRTYCKKLPSSKCNYCNI